MQLVQVLKIDARPLVMYGDRWTVLNPPFCESRAANQLALLLCFGVASLWWVFQSSKAKNWILALCLAVLLFGLFSPNLESLGSYCHVWESWLHLAGLVHEKNSWTLHVSCTGLVRCDDVEIA